MHIYPLIPVRDIVMFPGVLSPIFVTRSRSVAAVDEAVSKNDLVVVVAQSDNFAEIPSEDDMYKVGTVCRILQTVKMPDSSLKVMLEGSWRCSVVNFYMDGSFAKAEVERIHSLNKNSSKQKEVLRRSVLNEFEIYSGLNRRMPDDIYKAVYDIEELDVLADVISSHAMLKTKDKQGLLQTEDVASRLSILYKILVRENEILMIEREMHEKVQAELDKGQKNYYLREQLRVIRNELGDTDPIDEVDELKEKAASLAMPDEVREKLNREIDRYARMAPISPESTVSKNYISWLMDLPWEISSEDHIDLKDARKILEEDHYGLTEVKERILEFLAVRKLAGSNLRAQVICFVGPPGVGKTSLGRSIARTMGRNFVNMSLGGMRDEAEIRGHRRTYVSALPGRIIQKIKNAGTNNPVLLMDEIDKIGSDFRGDPASALLEVLDPEQNFGFTDNFLEVPFDLSKVMFITTANNISAIPKPLLDRMEIISLPGYVAEEKIKIAKKHLLPKIIKEHGLTENDINISDTVLKNIITSYTMEAGVRGLDKVLSKIARKIAAKKVESENVGTNEKLSITKQMLPSLLGASKLHQTRIPKGEPIGTALGLAWTETGGSVIIIEAAVMDGSGHVSYTGNLGDIMQESAQTALAYLRANSNVYGLEHFEWQKKDIHIHVPEGAVPKDGPSAGITLALSLCSALTGRTVDVSYAMTGEMTLHGNVLPIGGVREKILAAKRMGVKKLLIPQDNKPDVEELSEWITKDMKIYYVSKIDEILSFALIPGEKI